MEASKYTAFSEQIGGSHYKDMPFQPIHLISYLNLDFFQGNVVKYVSRYKLKDGVRDLEKAKHYCRMAMEMKKSSSPTAMTALQVTLASKSFVLSNRLSQLVADVIVYVYGRKWEEAVKAIDALSKEHNQSELDTAKKREHGERLDDDNPKVKRAQQWTVEIKVSTMSVEPTTTVVYIKGTHDTPQE